MALIIIRIGFSDGQLPPIGADRAFSPAHARCSSVDIWTSEADLLYTTTATCRMSVLKENYSPCYTSLLFYLAIGNAANTHQFWLLQNDIDATNKHALRI